MDFFTSIGLAIWALISYLLFIGVIDLSTILIISILLLIAVFFLWPQAGWLLLLVFFVIYVMGEFFIYKDRGGWAALATFF